MILLQCPYSGFRNINEFVYLGENVSRPDPKTASRKEWRAYLYNRKARAGVVEEMWYHRNGSRQYFMVERDTTNNEVVAVHKIDHADSAAPETTSTSHVDAPADTPSQVGDA